MKTDTKCSLAARSVVVTTAGRSRRVSRPKFALVLLGLAILAGCSSAASSHSNATTTTSARPSPVPVHNSRYRLAAPVSIPKPPGLFDVSAFDPATETYLLSDISNGTVDIFNARTHSLVDAIPGFTLPSGIVILIGTDQAWVGEGGSLVKVLDMQSDRIIGTISTQGHGRADELSYDAADRVVAVTNDLDSPPFVTLISTGDHHIIGTVTVRDATQGLGSPLWDPATKRFYVSVPATSAHPGGELLVIDAKGRLTGTLYTSTACHPGGMAALSGGRLFVGCDTSALIVDSSDGRTLVSDPTGAVSSDEVGVAPNYDLAFIATSVGVGVVDTGSGKLTQMIPTPAGSHSLAVDPANAELFVPEPSHGAVLFAQSPTGQ